MKKGAFICEVNNITRNKEFSTSLLALENSEVFLINRQDLLYFFKKNLGILLRLTDKKVFL